MNTRALLGVLAFVAAARLLHGESATWNLNPTNNDWHRAANWTPEIVPNSDSDTAIFGSSNTTNVAIGKWSNDPNGTTTFISDIVFAAGASSYTIAMTPEDIRFASILEVDGGGITNNSGVVQNFVTAAAGENMQSGRIYFNNSASAGESVIITNEGGAFSGGDEQYGGFTNIRDTASAGKATFINNGGTVAGASGGISDLLYSSSAESAMFINNPGAVPGAGAASTLVQTSGPIGNSTFIANPANVSGAEGGWVEIDVGTASGANFIANGATVADAQAGQIYVYGGDGYATFTGKGGSGNGAEGGLIDLFNLPASDQTIMIAESGTNGGLGGDILIEGEAPVELGQFQLFGNGVLDLTPATSTTVKIGSLAGDGAVLLAGHSLSIGNNNLSTVFSGLIQESGRVVKLGSGTLTLSGANTYTGGTTVSAGTLKVANTTGSATGTGAVKVKVGTLGGKGSVTGAVTIGAGNGAGAVLAPSVGANQPATLTLQSTLTFKADGTYTYKLNTNNARADQVIARRVSIESGAQFVFQAVANKKLSAGIVFTAINNTSANAIAGTFANLPDGSTFTSGRNKFQVSYAGGSGNDLTLTVVP